MNLVEFNWFTPNEDVAWTYSENKEKIDTSRVSRRRVHLPSNPAYKDRISGRAQYRDTRHPENTDSHDKYECVHNYVHLRCILRGKVRI